jgi:hypothetical protein
MEMKSGITRAQLLAREWIQEPPIVSRMHNRHRKDLPLTVEQQETLKVNFGIQTSFRDKGEKPKVMTEKEILTILRKRFKKHRFTETMFFKVD